MTDYSAVFGTIHVPVAECAPRTIMTHEAGHLGVSLGALVPGVDVHLSGTADELLDFAAALVAIVPRELTDLGAQHSRITTEYEDHASHDDRESNPGCRWCWPSLTAAELAEQSAPAFRWVDGDDLGACAVMYEGDDELARVTPPAALGRAGDGFGCFLRGRYLFDRPSLNGAKRAIELTVGAELGGRAAVV